MSDYTDSSDYRGPSENNANSNYDEHPVDEPNILEVMSLIESGIDVNSYIKDSFLEGWDTLLTSAADKGHTEVVKLLIQKGADVNKSSKYGITPLMAAASKGRTEIADLLIQHGASVNKADESGNTPLTFAADEGRTETIKLSY